MENIYFLKKSLYNMNVIEEAKRMVRGYMVQDQQANASNVSKNKQNEMRCMRWKGPEGFVDYQTIIDMYTTRASCYMCGNRMSFEKNTPHKVTVNRLNDTIGHYKGNIELMCRKCNCSRKKV